MNHSNWYGMETMAREQQAEIEKQLRQAAELRKMQTNHTNPLLKVRWAAIGATALSLLGSLAFIVITHAH